MRSIILMLVCCAAMAATADDITKGEAEIATMQNNLHLARYTLYAEWLKTADLTLIRVPTLGGDPKSSEIRRATAIKLMNMKLKTLESWQRGARSGSANQSGLIQTVKSFIDDKEIWSVYLDTH